MLASSRHVRSVELVDASKLTYAHEFVTRWWYAYDAVCARYKMRSIELTQSDSGHQTAALISTQYTCASLLLFNNSRAKHPACKAVSDGILVQARTGDLKCVRLA